MPADPRRTSLCRAVSKTILIWGKTGSDPAFQAVIWLFLGIGQAIIPHLKEDIQGYLLTKNLTSSPTDRYFMIIFWRLADLCQHASSFWSVTLQPLVADQATIQQMKGDIHGFHIRHKSLIYYKRLQRYGGRKPLYLIGLVL